MTAHERATAFIRRYPSHTFVDKKFAIAALEIEFLEAAADPQTRPDYKPVSTFVPAKPLNKRAFGLGVYGE